MVFNVHVSDDSGEFDRGLTYKVNSIICDMY